MSPAPDLRASFSFNLFCLAALSTLLILALGDSMNPTDSQPAEATVPGNHPSHADNPSVKPALKDHPLPHGSPSSPGHDLTLIHLYWDPQGNEDNYWEDDAAA